MQERTVYYTIDNMEKKKLSGNALKIIALLSMTIDHVGLMLLNDYMPFRYIGRLAFPLFGYMLAEGCYYTRNKRRHFMGIFLLAMLCQAVYLITERSIYQGILITFSLSILTIYAIAWAREEQGHWLRWLLAAGVLSADVFLCVGLPTLLVGTDYAIDYGIWGVLFPVLVSLSRDKRIKWWLAAIGLVLLSISMGDWQWYCLFALIPIWLYNGQKGVRNTKYLFYVYYPLHLVIIYGIWLVCNINN